MYMKNKKHTLLKIYACVMTVCFLLAVAAFLLTFVKAGYYEKIMVKLGLKEPAAEVNWAVGGWNNTLMKLDYDADAVFLGDSITHSGDFRLYFPDKEIVNLGYYGDTLSGMIQRVPGAAALNPEKVFVLGGINGLTDRNIDTGISTYDWLLEELQTALPDAEIYVQSVLPVSDFREHAMLHNTSIAVFNARLAGLADTRGCVYVDLYTLFEKDGQMNPELTADGLHLVPEAYGIWAEAIAGYMD